MHLVNLNGDKICSSWKASKYIKWDLGNHQSLWTLLPENWFNIYLNFGSLGHFYLDQRNFQFKTGAILYYFLST